MAEIGNSGVIKKLVKVLNLQTGKDKIPSELAEKIQAVVSAEPERTIFAKEQTCSDATTTTIFTTDAKKNTYAVGVSLSVSKDAVATSTSSRIAGTLDEGGGINLIRIRYEPLTAGQFTESITFPYPIKLAKSSNVSVANSTAIASVDASATIFYYEEDRL